MKTRMNRKMQSLAVLMAILTTSVFAFSLAQDAAPGINLAESSELGQYLVDQDGMALYLFVPDAQGASTCYGDCAANWPALTVASADALPTAGEGLDATLLATVERDDGSLQVTYNGWPLYYFAGDMEAGVTGGQGLGSNWFVVDATGNAVGMAAGDM